RDWSSDVCSSDLDEQQELEEAAHDETSCEKGGRATPLPRRGHSSGIFPARMSRSHCSWSGQDTAQVPKSAMCWYFVSRSIAFWRIFGSFRKTGPWLGSRYSASSSRMRASDWMKLGMCDPWWASMAPTHPSL